MNIERLTVEDCEYLATFTSLDRLSLNQTHLKSLEHFPKNEKLVRLELAENQLPGAELVHLKKYADTLTTLKLASNKIGSLDDLEHLKELKCLKNLDLENNEVTKAEGYKERMWKMLPALQVLDNCNQEGEEVLSEDEDYGSYGEEGEEEGFGDALTEEQLEVLKRKGISVEDFLNGEGDFDDEEGEDDFDGMEGGEDELDESDSQEFDFKDANKRSKQ